METGLEAHRQTLIGWAILLFWFNLYLFLDFWLPMIQNVFPKNSIGFFTDEPSLSPFWLTEIWCFDVGDLGYGLAYSPIPFILVPIYGVIFYVAPTALSIWWTVRLFRKWKQAKSAA